MGSFFDLILDILEVIFHTFLDKKIHFYTIPCNPHLSYPRYGLQKDVKIGENTPPKTPN